MNEEPAPQRATERDERLTAFAMGELNEAERAEFAAKCDAPERAAADSIARLGGLLRRASRDEPCPARSDDLRRAVESRLSERELTLPPRVPSTSRWSLGRIWLPMSLAASLLVIGTLAVALRNRSAHVPPVAKTWNDAVVGDNHGAEKRPEGFWQEDDVQYHPPGPDFKLAGEAAAMKAAKERSRAGIAEGEHWYEGSAEDGMRQEGDDAGATSANNNGLIPETQIGAGQPANDLIDPYSRQVGNDKGGGEVGDDISVNGQRHNKGAPEPKSDAGAAADPLNDGEPSDHESILRGRYKMPGTDPNGIVAPSESNADSGNKAERKPQSSINDMGFDGRKKRKNAKSSDRKVDEAKSEHPDEWGIEADDGGRGERGRVAGAARKKGIGAMGGMGPGGPGGAPGGAGAPGAAGGPPSAPLGRGMRSGGMGAGPGGAPYGVAENGATGGASGSGGKLLGGREPPKRFGLFGELNESTDSEAYEPITENAFLSVVEHALSTFSIDVDTASYANVRRFINSHALPPSNAVRIEEMINYFSYDYPQPDGDEPFSVTTEVAGCPWEPDHRLLRVGLMGRTLDPAHRPASNLVFLIDVSGSMDQPNKLPLVKQAMQLLTEQLTENDRVAIVVYAGQSGLVLPPTSGNQRETICRAIAGLTAGGSTNGGQGIQMAYELAQAHFVPGGTNRVILATDGDFNVGITDRGDLVRLIEEKAAEGVGLSALGFGAGNLKDATLEKLADRGNGNYAYIDTAGEARKVLVEQLCGTLVTIAKDVKLQIEFNPAQVASYRLIGYENRLMRDQDFNDDRKDAGEIGAGHTVTALYELVPAGHPAPGGVDALKYQRVPQLAEAAGRNELGTLALRYKPPEGEKSKRLEHVISDAGLPYGRASRDFKFAASVAACGMLLRGSQYAGEATWDAVIELAGEGLGEDPHAYRAEFLELVKSAKALAERQHHGRGASK